MPVHAAIFVLAVEEFVEMAHGRNHVEVVFLRWVGREPLQRTRIPWIDWCGPVVAVRHDDVHNEQEHTDCQHQRTQRRHKIPEAEIEKALAGARFGPHVHSTWLTLESNHVHGSEREVEPDHHHTEVPTPDPFGQHLAEDLGPPVVEPGEEPQHSTTEEHVVKVCDDVVRVGLLGIRRRNGVRHT